MAKPLLVATVAVAEPEFAKALAAEVAPLVDLVEFRLDHLDDPDPASLVAACPAPALLTCRPVRQGGRFEGPESDRLDLLRAGIRAGAAWIDVELDAAARLGGRGASRLVVSWHDPEGTPADLDGILAAIRAHRPDVAKLVPTARGPGDVRRVLDLLRRSGPGVAAHPMGRPGRFGRVLAAHLGSALVYGSAAVDAGGAPDQPLVRDLVDDYGLNRDRTGSALILLFGGDLSGSVSPRMLNRAFAAAGIDAILVPFETRDPEEALAVARDLGATGAAVTMPLKETIAARVSPGDAFAARCGAVNTLRFGDAGPTGFNTDGPGALAAIRSALPDLAGRRAVVIGAGGAAAAAVHALVGAGVPTTVVNRDPTRAARLAAAAGATAATAEALDPEPFDLVVNATPAGLAATPSALLRSGRVVFDMVHHPAETALLAAAKAAGCRTVPGIRMLAAQAARQSEIWFGRTPPPDQVLAEGEEALAAREGLVLLVGMRGAGKSTVGALVARELSRPFFDVDLRVERAIGRSIREIFAVEGEAAFRRYERSMLRRALDRPDAVVAAGAGAFDAPAGRAVLATRRVRVVWLRAPAAVLIERIRGSARPALSALPLEEEVEILLARREPVYRRIADFVVDGGPGDPRVVAEELVAVLRSSTHSVQ